MIGKLKFSFFRKILLVSTFFIITPVTIISSSLALIFLEDANSESKNFSNLIISPQQRAHVYSSFSNNSSSIYGEVIAGDGRAEVLKNFALKYNSPLSKYTQTIVDMADKYGIDWRLTTAIAAKESGLCRVIPEGSFNCWGWGIHSQGTLKFSSYEEAIEVVSKGLRQNYIDKGYETISEIMEKYAHPASTTWADDVLYYMDQIR